jgi:hypothetical protein
MAENGEVDLNTWWGRAEENPGTSVRRIQTAEHVVRAIVSRALQEQMTYQHHLNLRPSSDHAKNFVSDSFDNGYSWQIYLNYAIAFPLGF